MIRIDEIYYNTFLPRIQQRPNSSMHYFDPFGSVAWQDLCSQPAVAWRADSTRYLFWDQEPLHPQTVKPVLDQFTSMYNDGGQHHIITSEQQSTELEGIVATYNLVPHYYFFHGWAALDWFRGYDRTYLMRPYSERQIRRTFIMPNRIVAGARQHRLIMLYHIFKMGMTNNHISCPEYCPAEGISILDSVQQLKDRLPDIVEVFTRQTFPIEFANESGAPMHSCWLSLFEESAESLLYLVTETVAAGRRLHLTEKTFKPIALKMPFILVGTQGSLEYLRSYGFRTFGHIWDESYDLETNDLQRYERIAETLRALDSAPLAERQRLFELAEEVCEHNYNHFYSGGFERILWAELEGMLDELGV